MLYISVLAYPQTQSAAGNLRGVVTDPAGAAIRGAKLTLTDDSRGFSRTETSSQDGEFEFRLLSPGSYRLRTEAAGFSVKVLEQVVVRVGDAVSLKVELEVGAIQQEIEVKAELPVVETARYQQANTVELARIRDLPINRRNFLDFALLAPATSDTTDMVDGTDYRVAQAPQSGISFGGGNGRGNGFMIDGVENYVNSGGVRLSVSQEAVQEFQINRNSTSVEFGWASGGMVNIVTRSGGNQFRGNLFGFLRHRNIQARNYFDPEKSAFTRSQAGATLGGPLQKDKSFFFLAYERLDRQETSFVPILQDRTAFGQLTPSQQQLAGFFTATGVPQLVGLAQQMRGALVPANNPRVTQLFNQNSGTFPFGEATQSLLARWDHRFSDRHSVFVRGNLSDSAQTNAQFGALVAYNRGRAYDGWDGTLMASDTFVLGPRTVVESRVMFNYNTIFFTPVDPYGPELNITGFGFFGRDIFLPSRTYERHYQVMQNWNVSAGKHDLKFGFDINPVRDTVISETFFSGRFNFGEAVPLANVLAAATGDPTLPGVLAQTLQQLGRGDLVANLSAPVSALQAFSLGLPTFYQQGFGNPNWIGWSKRYSMYLQDNWRVSQGLTLNLGLRYDLEVNEKVLGTDKNNFGPRAGFAWSPDKQRRTVIRGGYGFFFMPTNLQIANVADTLSGRYINQVFVPLTGVTGINNPATGRPTTSSDIYQGLLRQGVIGNRSIRQEDLLPFGVRVGPGLPLRVEFGSDPIRQGYAQQGSFEIERALGSYAVSLGYNYNRGLGIARISGRNLFYTGQFRPDGTPIYGRIDPTLLQKNIFTYDGISNFHALILQVQKRLDRNFALQGHYTFSKAIDDVTDFNSDFSPMDQLNKRGERALSPFHHAHRVVVNALYTSPLPTGRSESLPSNLFGGWNVAPIFVANSWRPFNILAGADINGDGYVTNDRPFPAGRNVGRGPNFVTFDLRLSRRFGFGDEGRRNIEFIAEGFNLANRTNFRTLNNTVGAVPLSSLARPITGIAGASPTSPLAYTSANDARQFQFGLKINF
jgi:hypothetical protein